jgi:hypothetical protein
MLTAEDREVLVRPLHPPKGPLARVEKTTLHRSGASWTRHFKISDLGHALIMSCHCDGWTDSIKLYAAAVASSWIARQVSNASSIRYGV